MCDGCHQCTQGYEQTSPHLPHTSGEEPSPTMDGLGQRSNGALEVQDPAVGSVLKRRNELLQRPRSCSCAPAPGSHHVESLHWINHPVVPRDKPPLVPLDKPSSGAPGQIIPWYQLITAAPAVAVVASQRCLLLLLVVGCSRTYTKFSPLGCFSSMNVVPRALLSLKLS